ncbi:Retrovirus-related Pol polyprotein from transposon RE1 [Vitis vinifera]|uniref:Retrovirus-related Pol polyprotein from transposon RE1 n=1 Tax=Vitis vinifera TaxID=29760 RepID=A0A438HEK7_VITVI|nr:Retrovirus-related Pol polyprotein from transposon RE1 [Vitis vinifera]
MHSSMEKLQRLFIFPNQLDLLAHLIPNMFVSYRKRYMVLNMHHVPGSTSSGKLFIPGASSPPRQIPLRTTTGLRLTQSKYMTDLLIKTKMHSAKPVLTPMSAALKLHAASGPAFSDPTLYRSTIGALQYLTYTRLDIAFAGTVHCGLHFTPASSLHLQVYTDVDWASSIDDRRSTTGYCVFLGTNLLTWSSRKLPVVARSSTEAEYRALAHASTEVAWLRSLFSELGISLVNTPILWCDNQGAGALAANPDSISAYQAQLDVSPSCACGGLLS